MNDDLVELSRTIYVHSTSNPPLPDVSIDANIQIQNSNKILLTNWAKTKHLTQYTIKIKNPKTLCQIETGQTGIEHFFENLLLAINILMRKGAMTIYNTDMSQFEIERKKLQKQNTEIIKNEKETKLIFNEVLEISDTHHITMGFDEIIDESSLIELLKKIVKIGEKNESNMNVKDLRKSLNEYANAMGNFNRLGIFKSLFSALELATNCDGKDKKGTDLDLKTASLTQESATNIKEWRTFNARLKHVDINEFHKSKYRKGMKQLPGMLNPLRKATREVILQRIKKI